MRKKFGFQDIAYRSINIVFFGLMSLVLFICLFLYKTDYAYRKLFQLPNWLYVGMGLLVISLICFLVWLLRKKINQFRYHRLFMLLLSGLFCCLLVMLSYHYYFKTGWDSQMVVLSAEAAAKKDWAHVQNKYFSYYPNNAFLVFLFSVPIRIGMLFGIKNYYFCVILFQCVLFAGTGYLLYRCAQMLTDPACGVAVWFLYVLLIGLSPWVVIPYSDATGLIFPMVQFYAFLRIRRKEYPGFFLFLLTFTCYIGYRIKPQAAIMGIAILIVTIISFGKVNKKDLRRIALSVFSLCLGFLLGFVIVQSGIKATGLEMDPECTFGLPHFIMLGLNDEYGGVINIVDQDFSMSFSNAKERNQANLRVALERIRKMKVSGLLKLGKEKILTNFTDGTFAWWEEGEFIIEQRYEGNRKLRETLSSFYYKDGKYFEAFKNIMQTLWFGCLAGLLLGFRLSGERKEIGVLKLSVIGIFLFETIFEARARYLFLYVPFILLLVIMGIYQNMGKWKAKSDAGTGHQG